MPRFSETLYDAYGQEFRIDEMLFEIKSDHQHIVIFHNAAFGRVLALDGVVQTTERDEFIYHEMMTHLPILAHGNAERILVIGGGDGGILREVTRHANIQHITQVEIDQAVIDLCREHLPNHSNGAYDDPRVRIVIDDGLGWVSNTPEKYDVIICDSTDPIGPGEVLFQKPFYAACKKSLTQGGLLVSQNGVAFMQLEEVKQTARRIAGLFADWHFYSAAVPTYVGGIMTFAWATDNLSMRQTDIDTIKARFSASGVSTRYYTPEIHKAAFALPQYILSAIGK